MKAPAEVVLASSNKGKLAELSNALAPFGTRLIPQATLAIDDAIEDGLSFVENALIKARHASKASQLPALADDSGLEVDVLQGAPGIYSARYCEMRDKKPRSDRNNVQSLLSQLQSIGAFSTGQDTTAHYQCILCYVRGWDDPTPLFGFGTWSGRIVEEPQGDQGFGYDPIFYCDSESATAAQLSPERKTALSHRTKALAQLLEHYQRRYGLESL